MGEPVYTALGYRPHFRLHMYERRDQTGGAPDQAGEAPDQAGGGAAA
jgi:hypothetical protein